MVTTTKETIDKDIDKLKKSVGDDLKKTVVKNIKNTKKEIKSLKKKIKEVK